MMVFRLYHMRSPVVNLFIAQTDFFLACGIYITMCYHMAGVKYYRYLHLIVSEHFVCMWQHIFSYTTYWGQITQ